MVLDADTLEPFVTWGTNPGQGVSLSAKVPSPEDFGDENAKAAAERALQYMDLEAGTPMKDIRVDTVFLGSCTNSRIEDLRAAADIIRGRTKDPNIRMLVVPGSARVRLEAEAEGLDKVFKDFGAEWRFAGCSMCLGMNPDQLAPGERCASTSNRNFEGRQGKGGRTHLVSPVVAAATAVRGTLSSPSDLDPAPESAAIRIDAAVAANSLEGSAMEKFTTHTGIGVPLRQSNVDTDQIIPAVYLKRVTRTGFEDALFAAWRKDPAFILNQEPFNAGSVLVAGPDFGTGSSREHAVWALKDYGFKTVLSSRFADIFRGNSGKQGLLAAELAEDDIELIWKELENAPGTEVTVDLVAKTVQCGNIVAPFEIDDYTRWRLLEGLDDIGLTLHEEDITAFEATRPRSSPRRCRPSCPEPPPAATRGHLRPSRPGTGRK